MSINKLELDEKCIYEIEKQNLDKVKQFLSSGININSILRSKNEFWDTNCFSILAIASYYGSNNIVEFLLQHKVNVNQLDFITNRSPLHWATAARNYEIVNKLIEAGARINALDRNKVTPLILAVQKQDINIVKLLIVKGANVNQKDRLNLSALSYACLLCDTNLAIELIINGCECTWSMAFNLLSPLKFLLEKKLYKIVNYLIESGYDLSNEKWIVQNNNQKSEPAYNWVEANLKTPKKLTSLCRLHIRRDLGGENLLMKLAKLNIPKNLIEYLQMKN